MKLVLYTTVFWFVIMAMLAVLCLAYGIPPYITDLQGNFLLGANLIAAVLSWCAFALGIGADMENTK